MDKKKRKKHNQSIVDRMKRGEPLNSVPPQATWFPPRPTIKKDPEAIKKLYGVDINNEDDRKLKIVKEDEENKPTPEV